MTHAWECSQTDDTLACQDRPRYLRWVWEVSQLPFVFLALGECRDAYRLKLARAWKRHMDEWCRHQMWLQDRGNPHAWNLNVLTREGWLRRWHGACTEDDLEDGEQLMLEIGYYGISDEYRFAIREAVR